MKIHTFAFELIDSKMYIILERQGAIIIDPNVSETAAELLCSQNIQEVKIILTHEHYDHISGVEWFREQFACTVYCSEECNVNMQSSLKNGSKYFKALFLDREAEKLEEASRIQSMTCIADMTFEGKKEFIWNGHRIVLVETPGHSPGSICILLDDQYLFTGDSLLKNDPTITRLPGGNKRDYMEKTLPFLKNLDKEMYVYPGHGESGWLKEFNI